jgi:predicted dehydrogenase
MGSKVKRYALAGASSRALDMYGTPIREHYADTAVVVGVFDVNPARASYVGRQIGDVPVFDDFDDMLRRAAPDCVIVTTVDRYHHEYIIRALEAGCDAITEKPMTIDDEKCRAILAAERRTGRTVTVTFNYRFVPYNTRIKEVIRAGAIGEVLNVDFEWLLDTRHGADYFRRWHRRKENSGGLLVHKATHHFDLVNWWIEDEPEEVRAFGERRVYGPTRVERGERCSTCAYTRSCEFFVDYASNPQMRALYFETEHLDGYYRDSCVFSDDVDIMDTMSVQVRYAHGPLLTYSLIAYSPYEGWRASITGSRGRMEMGEFTSGLLSEPNSDRFTVFSRQGEVITHDIPQSPGGHGGGDVRLWDRLFSGCDLPDPLHHAAGSHAGAMSVLVGVAGNKSIASGLPVRIADLLREPAVEQS